MHSIIAPYSSVIHSSDDPFMQLASHLPWEQWVKIFIISLLLISTPSYKNYLTTFKIHFVKMVLTV
jgi:hypothetical protein